MKNSTETFDIASEAKCTPKIGFERYAAVGGLLEEKYVVVCGGKGHKNLLQTCISWNLQDDSQTKIQMVSKRYAASAVTLNESVLWIVGGRNESADLDSSEFIDLKDGSSEGPKIPFTLKFHCMVGLNDSAIFIIGGHQNGSNTKQVWIINTKRTEFTFKPGVSMNQNRKLHACNKMADEYNNTLIMVAGGKNEKGEAMDTTEIFNVTSNNWTFGKW